MTQHISRSDVRWYIYTNYSSCKQQSTRFHLKRLYPPDCKWNVYCRNKVRGQVLYDLYKRMVLPADNGRAGSASPLCMKFRPFIEVIKYEPEDFISIIKTSIFY